MGVQVANPEHVGPISSFSQDSGQHNQLSLKVILTSRPSSYLSCPCLRLVVVTLPAPSWSVVAGTRGKADVLSSVRRPYQSADWPGRRELRTKTWFQLPASAIASEYRVDS